MTAYMNTEVLVSRTGNPLSPVPFVSHAKSLPAKRRKKGYGDENTPYPTRELVHKFPVHN